MTCSACGVLNVAWHVLLMCTSAPPEIENGSYEGTDYPATEDIFTYKCNDNYFAHRNYSNNAIATCTSFGNYSVATNDLIKCLPKVCSPPDLDKIRYSPNASDYTTGDVVSYTCAYSTSLDDIVTRTAVCGSDGWIEEPYCPKNPKPDCGLPKPIANGKSDIVTTEYIYYFGEKIALPQQLEYYCDTSFAFTESSQSFLTCDDSSSSFEPALPTCARECGSVPEQIHNGTVEKSSTAIVPGTVISFICDVGFEISTTTSEFVCGSDGFLEGYDEEPTCIFACRSTPQHIENGQISREVSKDIGLSADHAKYSTLNVPGTKLVFECDDDYVISSYFDEIECSEQGFWLPFYDEVKCLASCPNLDSFLGNGLIDSLKTERPGISLAGDVRRYYCEKGFAFSEGNQTEYLYDCLPSGSWSTTESPDCVKECPALPDSLQNGKISRTPDRNIPGTTVTFTCNQGYEISTQQTEFSCGVDSQWSDYSTEPTCILVCPYTDTIENGKVSVNEDRAVPGTTITYRCNTNFALSTINSDFVCGENGSWTDFDTVPTCVSNDEDIITTDNEGEGDSSGDISTSGDDVLIIDDDFDVKKEDCDFELRENMVSTPTFVDVVEEPANISCDFSSRSSLNDVPEFSYNCDDRDIEDKFACLRDCPDLSYSLCITNLALASDTTTADPSRRVLTYNYDCEEDVCKKGDDFTGTTQCDNYHGIWQDSTIYCCGVNLLEKTKQCGIGLYNGSVTDDQITASDWFYSDGDNSIWYHPKNARLFKDIREGAWAVPESQRGHWIEVDLKKNEEIVSIATQGMARKNDNDRFVNSYHVQYQVDGESTYEYVTDDNEKKILFQGNSKVDQHSWNKFPQTITARKFRIETVAFTIYPTLRFELFWC